MRKLIGLLVGVLAAVGAATVVFFWRKRQGSWNSSWWSARDTATSWGTAVADEAGKSGDKVAAATDRASDAASDLVGQVKNTVGSSR